MIARAIPAPRPHTPPGTPSMVGSKIPIPHRFHLTDGRTIAGDLHKAPTARLTDHISTLKGFVCVTNACCERTGTHLPFIALNQDHILFIEEVAAQEPPARPTVAAGTGAGGIR